MDATDKQHRRMPAALFEQGQLRGSQIAQTLSVTTRAVNHWHRA